jgi:asparagine N-glycosylation enzyme membrane subunit Stt3
MESATPKSKRSREWKLLPLVVLGALAVYASILRCLHLLNPDHYYIISPDSHVFNWQAKLLLSGETPPMTLHSGLTYPMAYIARSLNLVTGMPPEQALKLAGILVPPLLGVISVFAIYLAVSRMYDRRAALFSAFAWAIASVPVFIQAAGYVDRDGLSIVLITMGVFICHFSRNWSFTVGRLELGWLVGGFTVFAVATFLYIEWMWLGSVILLSILFAVVAIEMLTTFASRLVRSLLAEEDLLAMPMVFLKTTPSGIVAAVRGSNWKPLAAVLTVSLLVGTVAGGSVSIRGMYAEGSQLVRDALSGTATTDELQGLTAGDLLSYGLLTIPLLIGLYVAVRNRRRSDILLLGWLGVLFLGGLIAKRLFLYAAPAICVLAGLGLSILFDFGKAKLSLSDLTAAFMLGNKRVVVYARMAGGVVLVVLLLLASFSAYHLGSYRLMAAGNEWEAALTYLREGTPEEAVVMSWWDYGYWILDIAGRQPVVDNGRHWEQIDRDIALVYVAEEDSEAIGIMERYGANYLVFSTLEYGSLPRITELALGERLGDFSSIPAEMRDSLYARSLSGTWEFGDRLKRVYPGPEVEEPEVVILRVW